MNKKILIAISLVLSMAVIVMAQTDSNAKALLDKVSRQYKSYKTLEVKYSLFSKKKEADAKITRENGDLFLKGDKYMMTTNDKEIYCNGDTLWTYDKVFGECTMEDYDQKKVEISPASIFTLHEKGFDYLLNGEIKIANEMCTQVDMTPKDKRKPYYKVRLAINKKKNHISRMTMMLKSATVTVSVNNQKENTDLPDEMFRFDAKSKGIPLVDLTSKKK